MRRRLRSIALSALLAGSLAACSSVKPYPDISPGNLVVRSKVSGARVALHVFRVKADCSRVYQGSVRLDRSPVRIGLPAGRMSYLVFGFDTSSFLSGKSLISFGTLLEPRRGRIYLADVSYHDSLYNVTLRETDPRRGTSRELPRRDLADCGR